MSCSVPHTIDEIMTLVDKLIAEDRARQQALFNLPMQFEKGCEFKDDRDKHTRNAMTLRLKTVLK